MFTQLSIARFDKFPLNQFNTGDAIICYLKQTVMYIQFLMNCSITLGNSSIFGNVMINQYVWKSVKPAIDLDTSEQNVVPT